VARDAVRDRAAGPLSRALLLRRRESRRASNAIAGTPGNATRRAVRLCRPIGFRMPYPILPIARVTRIDMDKKAKTPKKPKQNKTGAGAKGK
jgi:hypothetical protein